MPDCCQHAVELLGERASNERKVNPTLRAGSCVSFHSATFAWMLEFHSTATRTARGTISFRSSTRLLARSGARALMPVTLPPGRARFLTKPTPIGSGASVMTIGIVSVACSGGTDRQLRRRPRAMITLGRRASSLAKTGQTIQAPVGAALFEPDVTSLDVAEVAEPKQEWRRRLELPSSVGVAAVDETDGRTSLRLLRPRRERPAPPRRRAA